MPPGARANVYRANVNVAYDGTGKQQVGYQKQAKYGPSCNFGVSHIITFLETHTTLQFAFFNRGQRRFYLLYIKLPGT
jgi:hypothetical protein